MDSLRAQFTQLQRDELQQVFIDQHRGFAHSCQLTNIDCLNKPNAFVVATGQQIHLGMGPMYVIYKIASAIVLCNDLRQKYPQDYFVPVFWMATEDHDVAEINYMDIFKERFSWDLPWNTGVGEMPTTELSEVFDGIKSKFERNSAAMQRLSHIFNIYNKPNQILSKATAEWVSELFGEFGLLVLDPSDVRLKKQASDVIRHDLMGTELYESFQHQIGEMKQQGVAAAAHVRECNVFWMDHTRRSRIVKTNEGFETSDGDLTWSKDEMKLILSEDTIKNISPNVLLRPLIQQAMLPCVAYVAGPTEYMYWLETTKAFKIVGKVAPALIHRKGGVVVSESQLKKLSKLGIETNDAFLNEGSLKLMLLKKQSGNNELREHAKIAESALQEYLKVLYNWKSEHLSDSKKQIDLFLKWQNKVSDQATDEHLISLFSESSWNGAMGIIEEVFSVKSPQERKVFFLQYFLSDGSEWLRSICKGRNYDSETAFWLIES